MLEGSWTIEPCSRGDALALAAALGISETTASVLVRRGLCDPDEAAQFLAGAPPGHDPDWQAPLDDSELYGPLRHRSFPHRVDETIEERVGTISYVGAMDERERGAFLEEVRRICANFGVDSSRPAPMPYVTSVHLTRAR